MPYCYVGSYQTGGEHVAAANNNKTNGIKIFYNTYGHGPIKVLSIIGLAGTHDSWLPQIKGLTGTVTPNDDYLMEFDIDSTSIGDDKSGVEVCAFDIEESVAVPYLQKNQNIRAMISCKLASLVPERVHSLALLNVTGGGYECFPKIDRKTLSVAIRFLRAKTPEHRAAVDLDTHYTHEYLEEYVGHNTRRSILYLLYYAKKLAQKLHPFARMVELHGGHLVSHERTEEVNQALGELIEASEKKISPYEWTNLPTKSSGWTITRVYFGNTNSEGVKRLYIMVDAWEKLCFFILYVFSLFVFVFTYLERGLTSLKRARVAAASK